MTDRKIGFEWGMRLGWAALCLVVLQSLSDKPVSAAESSEVQFDVESLVGCNEVTTDGFVRLNPGERLVQAHFPVSVLSRLHAERTLAQIWIRIESPDASLNVFDFAPRTATSTSVVGTLQVQGSSERSREWSIQLQGQSPGIASGEAQALDREHETAQYQYERLPPLDLCAASGTIRRGQGVFFKIQAGPRNVLEGTQDLTVVFRVPQAWRGDRVFVHCEAYGTDPGFGGLGKDSTRWAARSFVVALYQLGDFESRQRARDYLRMEEELRRQALRWAKRPRGSTSALAGIGSLLFSARGESVTWAEKIIYGRGSRNDVAAALPSELPAEIRMLATKYLAARASLESLAVLTGGVHR